MNLTFIATALVFFVSTFSLLANQEEFHHLFSEACLRGAAALDPYALLPCCAFHSATDAVRKQKELILRGPIKITLSPEDYSKPAPPDRVAPIAQLNAMLMQKTNSIPYSVGEMHTLSLKKGDSVKIGNKEFVLGDFLYADYGAHVFRLEGESDRAIALPFRSGDYYLNPSLPLLSAPQNLNHLRILGTVLEKKLETAGVSIPRIKISESDPSGHYAIMDAKAGETALEFWMGLNQKHGYGQKALGPLTIEETWRRLDNHQKDAIASAYHKHRAGPIRDKVRESPLEELKIRKLSEFHIRMIKEVQKIQELKRKELDDAKGDEEKIKAVRDSYDSLIYNLDISVPFQLRNVRWDPKTQDWLYTSWYAP